MLKNDGLWSEEAKPAFDHLKSLMVSAPVLWLADFNQSFALEADANEKGIGAVLMQEDRPITFLSNPLSQKKPIPLHLQKGVDGNPVCYF